MDPMTFMTIASVVMGMMNSASAEGQATKLSQAQQKQQADLMRQQAQEKANVQIQQGQTAATAKAVATKNQYGPENAGFNGMLFQPAQKSLMVGAAQGGGKLFGM